MQNNYSEISEATARGLTEIALAVHVALVCMLLLLVIMALVIRSSTQRGDLMMLIALGVALASMFIAADRVASQILEFQKNRSPVHRNNLRKSIERLKERLST